MIDSIDKIESKKPLIWIQEDEVTLNKQIAQNYEYWRIISKHRPSWHGLLSYISINNPLWGLDLIIASGKWFDNVLDIISLGIGQFLSGPDDNLIPGDAVVVVIMDLLVLVRVDILFVLEVPMLGADSHSDGLFVDAVLDDCAEELVARTVYLDYARTDGGENVPQAGHCLVVYMW